MFDFLTSAFRVPSDNESESSLSSAYALVAPPDPPSTKPLYRSSATEGIEVRVGRPPHAHWLHIPRSVLKSCPVLGARLVQGCTVFNADPTVFGVVIDYLGHDTILQRLRPNTRNALEQLPDGSEALLRLAKAWHIADMLDLPSLQNKLIDTYHIFYLRLLSSRTRTPIERDPFTYLEDHMGLHTKLEKFIIDFHAGLARYESEIADEELQALPKDIARSLSHRREQLVATEYSLDTIATCKSCFYVGKSDKTRRAALHVITSTTPPLSTMTDSLPSLSRLSTGTLSASSPISPLAPPRAATLPIAATSVSNHNHRVRHSLPDITSITRQPELVKPRALVPGWLSLFGKVAGAPQIRSASMSTPSLIRAPLPLQTDDQQQDERWDDDTSDGETVYDLFSPNLRLGYDMSRGHVVDITTRRPSRTIW